VLPLTSATPLAHHRRLLRGRSFRLWFAAALSAGLGDWLGLFALQVLVVSLSESGTSVALFGLGGVMMAKLLPSVLLGPPAGVLADRFDRKRLLVLANVARAVLYVAVAFTRSIWLLLALVFVIECGTILFIAAKNALLPHLVDDRDLTEANQLTLLVTYGPLPFGAAIAALLSALAALLPRVGLPDVEPVTAALLLNALTFVLAAVLLGRMPVGPEGRGAAGRRRDGAGGSDDGGIRSALSDLREGLDHIVDRPVIRSLTTGVVAVFFGAGMVIALGPEFVRSSLGRPGEDWFGLMTVVGGGLLVGMGAATWLAARLPKERVFAGALVPAAALVVVIAFLPAFALAQVAGFLLALAAGTAFVLGFTMLHERTPDALRGRVFATFYTVARVAMFASLALGPFLAGAIGSGRLGLLGADIPYDGIRLTVAIGGVVGLLGAVPGFFGMLRATADDASGAR
jgi:dTMP kinase